MIVLRGLPGPTTRGQAVRTVELVLGDAATYGFVDAGGRVVVAEKVADGSFSAIRYPGTRANASGVWQAGALQVVWTEQWDPGRRRPQPRDSARSGVSHFLYVQRRHGQWSLEEPIYRARALEEYATHHSRIVATSAGRLDFAFSRFTVKGLELVHLRRDSVGWHARDLSWPRYTGVRPFSPIYPTLAVSPATRIYLAFVAAPQDDRHGGQRPDNTNSTFLIRSDDGGVTWSPPAIVSWSGGRYASQLQIVAGQGDTVHLLWARSPKGAVFPNTVVHTMSTDGGVTWTEPTEVWAPGVGRLVRTVRIVRGHSGEIQFAGSTYGGIWWAHYLDGVWSAPVRIREERRAEPFDIALDGRDRLHLLWEHEDADGGGYDTIHDRQLLYAVRAACGERGGARSRSRAQAAASQPP